MAKLITSGNSPGPALQPSTIDDPGKVRGAVNGITLSASAVTTRAGTSNSTVPIEDRGAILANSTPGAIVPYARLKSGTDLSGAKLLTLLATGIALVSPPALSQGAMGSGAPAAAPQPRAVAPTPQAPSAPTLIPTPPAMAPMGGAPQGGPGEGAGNVRQAPLNKSEPVIIYGSGIQAAPGAGAGNARQAPLNKSEPVIIYGSGIQAAPGAGGGQQERSRAPLPAGYGYDATGRIVYTGR